VRSFEALYPTKRAREMADKAVDDLNWETTTLADFCRAWLAVYGAAGGVIAKRRKGEPR